MADFNLHFRFRNVPILLCLCQWEDDWANVRECVVTFGGADRENRWAPHLGPLMPGILASSAAPDVLH